MIDQRNFMYLCYGMIAAWVVLTIYVISLVMRERRLRDQVQRLENEVGERPSERPVVRR